MVSINQKLFKYNKATKTFTVKGGDVRFDTSYELVNTKTGGSMVFHFDHSDGSEWNPNTKWYHYSEHGHYTLIIGNEDVTPAHAEAYFNAKMRNM